MKPTARRKLEDSQLSPAAAAGTQGFGDIDIDHLRFYLNSQLSIDAAQPNTDIVINRTIEGASTLKIDIVDDHRDILRSGKLVQGVDIQLDGLWFRLQQITKSGKHLTLTCEDREIAILRTYYKKLGPVSRDKISRAQFVLRLIRQVKEVDMKYFIPELITIQPIEETSDTQTWTAPTATTTTGGLPTTGGQAGAPKPNAQANRGDPNPATGLNLTVRGSPMTDEQAKNANIIIQTGQSQKVRRKLLVTAIMVGVEESTLKNLPGGPTTIDASGNKHIHKGVFQQDPAYWPASGDVGKDAAAFFERGAGIDRKYPDLTYMELAEKIQISGSPQLWAPWRTEAERIVVAYGLPGGDTTDTQGTDTDSTMLAGGSDYFFYRGVPPKQANGKWGNENSWTCIQRLASEVNWRAFSIGGTIYYLTEDWLFRSQAVHLLSEDSPGVLDISGDIDPRKKNGTLTLTVLMSRWAAPPGTMIQLYDMGPFDGKWLVSEVNRSVFDQNGIISLKQPAAALPEPATGNLINSFSQQFTDTGTGTTDSSSQYRAGTSLINPIAPGFGSDGNGGVIHSTDGLAGTTGPKGGTWPRNDAIDFFAKAGTPVLSPVSGSVIKTSGRDPSLGPYPAPGGALGWSVYIQDASRGSIFYMTHLGTRTVQTGTDVSIGEQIGTVADYDKYGISSHTHVGVKPGPKGHPNIGDLAKAPQALESSAGTTTKTDTDKVDDQNVPLFTSEGPEFYAAAYTHNKPFATAGPYITNLSQNSEKAYRAWVKKNGVPTNPDANETDYDMRGFYQAMQRGDEPMWHGGHFPDTWKTPYDTSFSNESKYATADCPFKWKGNVLIDTRNNQIIFRG